MTDFPNRLRDAALKFKNESIAYAQVRQESGKTRVRLQALEVARQFVGDVTYGRDPKGVLFYNDENVFVIPHADFKYRKSGSGNLVTIEIDFHESKQTDPYARFVARTSPNQLPHITSGEGDGQWGDFKSGSTQTSVIRREGGTRLNLMFPALRKTAYFETTGKTGISSWGMLLFRNVENLKDIVDGKKCVAVINRDIIVFHPQGEPNKNIGLFIPAGSLDIGTNLQSDVTWKPYNPDASKIASAEDVDEEGIEQGAGEEGNYQA